MNFDFYAKSAKKPLFVNYKYALPTQHKINYVQNECKRIQQRCSTELKQGKAFSIFSKILELNEYPKNFQNVRNIKKQSNHSTANQPPSYHTNDKFHNQISYFQIPYISDDVDNRILRIFHNLNLPVRISHQSFTLRMALNKNKQSEQTCKWKSCKNPNKAICFKQLVVYKVTCTKCQQYYIGSTARKLHTRITEHINHSDSSIYKHLHQCDNSKISVDILDKDHDIVNLRFREAMIIDILHPSINSKDECNDYRHLIFSTNI